MHETFAALILRALITWHSKLPPEQLQPWADAMADVCMNESECKLMAALATQETHFVAWAVDQSCNDREWRAAHQLHRVCDHGKAFGPWQVQDERFRGATPAFQASVVLEIMRRRPTAWTTWRAAQKLAASFR